METKEIDDILDNLLWDKYEIKEARDKIIELFNKELSKTVKCHYCGGRLENHLDYIRCTKCDWYWEPQDDPVDEWGIESDAWDGGFAENN